MGLALLALALLVLPARVVAGEPADEPCYTMATGSHHDVGDLTNTPADCLMVCTAGTAAAGGARELRPALPRCRHRAARHHPRPRASASALIASPQSKLAIIQHGVIEMTRILIAATLIALASGTAAFAASPETVISAFASCCAALADCCGADMPCCN